MTAITLSEKYRRTKARYFLVRIPLDDMPEVRAAAERDHVTITEKVLTYIEWGLEAEQTK